MLNDTQKALVKTLEYSGLFDGAKTKQEVYMRLKNITDAYFMMNVELCKNEVCITPEHTKETLTGSDIQELQEVAEDLCFYMSQAQELGLHNEILEKVRLYFSHVSMTIEFQSEIAPMAHIIHRFYQLIYEYRSSFEGLDANQIGLIDGFVKDFKEWVRLTFVVGSDACMLNESMKANFEMIEKMVKQTFDTDDLPAIDDMFF